MNKLNDLINWFEGKHKVLVALSGGVDSALVAFAAFQKLGNKALAVTANYQTLSKEELDSAGKVCKEIGIKQLVIEYDELENKNFVKNDQNRCFYCREELVTYLKQTAKKFGIKIIVDGTNMDDLLDYRPGIKAMNSNGVQNPLVDAKLGKSDIRKAAKIANLSVFNRPSNSCLASRIPWGQRVSAEKLARIEVGEKMVKKITCASQIRVRDFDGIAKVELYKSELSLISELMKNQIISQLKLIGFKDAMFDNEGYRPGKINVMTD